MTCEHLNSVLEQFHSLVVVVPLSYILYALLSTPQNELYVCSIGENTKSCSQATQTQLTRRQQRPPDKCASKARVRPTPPNSKEGAEAAAPENVTAMRK